MYFIVGYEVSDTSSWALSRFGLVFSLGVGSVRYSLGLGQVIASCLSLADPITNGTGRFACALSEWRSGDSVECASCEQPVLVGEPWIRALLSFS